MDQMVEEVAEFLIEKYEVRKNFRLVMSMLENTQEVLIAFFM